MKSTNIILDELSSLLHLEKETLLSGQLWELQAILEEKDQLIDDLSRRELRESEIDEIKKRSLENQLLLQNAMNGIRQVAVKLAAIRRVRKRFDTYTAQGNRSEIDSRPVNELEKRM